ncbi:4'-phosphopantetheinyl transferase superfamily protein [Marinifilum sp. N1E240]|uniref:4'-phosphopantetheinyl transferase family protein n=1 Tax=Marinifilum sp. N1E240 TaxID=2608082 RepID=UPI00128C84DF|nr:4'-phosphopantetheinyl transferase superfamily protein [Marinifilum sp. N1E240]MPQ45821.1 4'-phosphopantetheinyl transferase superfamily protein [Marinifilum sp. N1E240]
MPIFKHISIHTNCNLYIWKIDESLNQLLQLVTLNDTDIQKFEKFGSESRKKEFLCTRILIQKCLGTDVQVYNDEHGKPHLINSNLKISITHTKSFVAILLSKTHVHALDMEYLSERVYRIAPRFLSKSELENISETDKTLHLYQHWCAKECLIKLYGKKDVHLIDELKIDAFQPSDKRFTGAVCRADFLKKYTFEYLQFDDYLLVYSLK